MPAAVYIMQLSVITENNDLSAAWCLDAWFSCNVFLTEVDAGVSELCWLDDEVTCDVCSIARFSDVKFQWIGDMTVAAVDEDTWCASLDDIVIFTKSVAVPFNVRITDIASTF